MVPILSREKLAENLITFIPFIHRKLMKDFPIIGISKQQMFLLHHISHHNEKPMSYYSEKMMIPKSNLTIITDKLIEEGFIERGFDQRDRRIIILKITEKGSAYLLEFKKKVIKEMEMKLSVYSDSNINRLNELIEEMKIIFDKSEK